LSAVVVGIAEGAVLVFDFGDAKVSVLVFGQVVVVVDGGDSA